MDNVTFTTLVSLPPGANPDHADIDLRFFNDLFVADMEEGLDRAQAVLIATERGWI